MSREHRPLFYPVGPNVSDHEHRLYMDRLQEIAHDQRKTSEKRSSPLRPYESSQAGEEITKVPSVEVSPRPFPKKRP